MLEFLVMEKSGDTRMRFAPGRTYNLGYATRDNTSIFVSRGVGTVYVPVRINCPPDVAILTLRTAAA